MKYAVLLSLSSSFLLVACGGGNSNATVAATNNEAAIAQKANEPRTADPTAASPNSPITGQPQIGSGGTAAKAAPATTATTASSSDPEAAPPKEAKSDTAVPKKIGARHVLIMWMGTDRAPASVVRTREQALAVAQEVHRRAKKGDDFARLAVEFSDEPNAAGRGGSLGRFGKGQMVGAFEEAAFKLQVGQVSEIVETPFGFHIIQRTE